MWMDSRDDETTRPGGVKTIAAENIALRQQLVTMARYHKRSPKLNPSDRIVFGLLASWINPKRLHIVPYYSSQQLS